MARIDSFLTQLIAYEADALVVEAGDNLYLLKGEARQPLMQVRPGAIANAHVRALLDEIAPAEARPFLERGEAVSWDYRWSSCLFKVEVAVVDGRVLARFRAVAADVDVVVVGAAREREKDKDDDADDDAGGLQRYLLALVEAGGSDLHLTPGRPPHARVDGDIVPLAGFDVVDAYGLQKMIEEIAPPAERRALDDGHDVEFAYDVDGARVRCSIFRDHSGMCGVFRRFLKHVPSVFALGLPDGVETLCQGSGLVVVAGARGSGRSTTVAALVDLINEQRAVHIMTLERPVEVLHAPKRALVHQRSVDDRAAAVRAAVDVDVFVVGDLDDAALVDAALDAADGGALVIATATAKSSQQALTRIVQRMPAERQEQVRALVGETLRGVLCQCLFKKVGGGRVVAVELAGRGLPTIALHDSLRDLVSAGVIEAQPGVFDA